MSNKTLRSSAEIQAAIDALMQEADALDAQAQTGDITAEDAQKLSDLVDQLKQLTTDQQAAAASEQVARMRLARKQPTLSAPRIVTSRTKEVHERDDREARNAAWRAWALGGSRGYRVSRSEMVAAQDLGLDPTANTIELKTVRALSKGTSNAPVPADMTTAYSDKLKYYFPALAAIGSLSTADGRDLPYTTTDDTSNVSAIVGEASALSSAKDPTFGTITFKAWKYSTDIVKVSSELLQDSTIDIPSYLGAKFAERDGRAFDNVVISTGAGSAAPEGMLHSTSVAVNLATGNALTLAKLVAMETYIDPTVLAAPGCGMIMHAATWGAVRSLATSEGLPILWGDLANGVPPKFLGYDVFISNNMTSINSPGDNQPLILFGNFKEAYLWRSVAEQKIVRLDELFAGNDQVGFLGLSRVDGRFIQPSYVCTLNSYDSP